MRGMEDEKNTCMERGKSMYITSAYGLIGQYGKHEKSTSAHLVPGSMAEQRIHPLHRSLFLPPLAIGRESMRRDGPHSQPPEQPAYMNAQVRTPRPLRPKATTEPRTFSKVASECPHLASPDPGSKKRDIQTPSPIT